MNDIQTRLEEVLELAIQQDDVNTQIVLRALIVTRPLGMDDILADTVQQLSAKVLYPKWIEMKENLIAKLN